MMEDPAHTHIHHKTLSIHSIHLGLELFGLTQPSTPIVAGEQIIHVNFAHRLFATAVEYFRCFSAPG